MAIVDFVSGKKAVMVAVVFIGRHTARMCVMSCASFSPDKSGRHFLRSPLSPSPRSGSSVFTAALWASAVLDGDPEAAVGTWPRQLARFLMIREEKWNGKLRKKREWERRTNHTESGPLYSVRHVRERVSQSNLRSLHLHLSGIN